jgi:VWFA-related protein
MAGLDGRGPLRRCPLAESAELDDTLSVKLRLLSLGGVILCAASVIAAGPQQAPQFRAAIDLVHMDVSVLDRDRRPVRGLKAEEFEIYENGKLQTLSTFSAIDIPDVAEPSTPWMKEVPPDTRRNDTLNDRRLFVMVLDDASAQLDLAALRTAKDTARRFIDLLRPTDLMAIVFTLKNQHAQDFTSDRARLLAAVDRFGAGFRDMDQNLAVGVPGDSFLYFRYTVETLLKLSEILSELPQQRKAVVYVGQGVPVDAAAASEVVLSGQLGNTQNSGKQMLLLQRLRETFRKADRANVTFYTLDTCGLRAPPVPGRPSNCVPGLEVDFLRGIAEETGGYSTADTNQNEAGIQQVFRENATYYLLGFRSTNPEADGKFRRVEVRVKRPGLLVRTRSGYTADKQKDLDKKAEAEAEPLSVAVSGLLPKKDVPMQAWAAPFAVAGKSEAAVPVVLAFRHALEAREARSIETIDVRVDAYTPEGKRKAFQTLRSRLVLRPGPEGQAAYEVLTMLNLPPGRYQLRLAGSLMGLQKSGSVYYDVEVPDVSKAPLTWSGVAFQASPGVTIATAPKLQIGIPIIPTSQRLFARTDNVSAFARIHQGGKKALTPVPVTVSITDSTGRQVWKHAETFNPSRFAIARGADVLIAVPMAQLEPGSYRLRFEATMGAASIRDSRFTVR